MPDIGYPDSVSRSSTSLRVAWVVGGHPFDRPSLEELIASLPATVDLFEWPSALSLFEAEGARRLLAEYDVLALYDMPGIAFKRGESPGLVPPPPCVPEAWAILTEAGMPILALHHSIASWPTWDGFAEILKGRFHYVPARLRGIDYPDSGYAMNVRQTFSVVSSSHPVCAGLPPRFELTDETYQCPVFDDEIDVLITTDAPRDWTHHSSAHAAVRRTTDDSWRHEDASTAVAWTHTVSRSQVVYLQPGEGPESFRNPHYRTIISNAVRWLSTTKPRDEKGVQ